jgi:hypothetical protein
MSSAFIAKNPRERIRHPRTAGVQDPCPHVGNVQEASATGESHVPIDWAWAFVDAKLAADKQQATSTSDLMKPTFIILVAPT